MDLTILFALALANLSAAAPTAASTVVIRVDSWGGSVSLGPSKSNIINAVTTIIPGAPPTSQNGELFLWPGMSNGTGDLVQTTIESWSGGNSWCGANSTQWCVRASLFGGFGQKDSEFNSPVNGDDHVRIEYNLESDGQTWEQCVVSIMYCWSLLTQARNVTNALTGAFLSRFAYASGPYMTGYARSRLSTHVPISDKYS